MALGNNGPGWLFCPADRPERFEKAAAAADVVILDLEDGCAAKDRPAARQALIDTRLDPARTVVRVNPTNTSDHELDLKAVAATDYTTVMLGAYGYLPNDRRHSLKLFGNYEFTDEWSVGANLMVQSGRPESCYGVYRGLNTSFYGNIHFSCDTGVPTSGGNNGETIVPRGTVGRTPWTTSFDLNVAYKPGWAEGLQFKVDVFNLLNNRKPIAVNEQGEDAAGNPAVVRERTYLTPLAWQAPRSVRFMVQYDF